MDKSEAFKAELFSLLKKYNASIGFDYDECSDLSGVYGGCIVADVHDENGKIIEVKLSNDYWVEG